MGGLGGRGRAGSGPGRKNRSFYVHLVTVRGQYSSVRTRGPLGRRGAPPDLRRAAGRGDQGVQRAKASRSSSGVMPTCTSGE